MQTVILLDMCSEYFSIQGRGKCVSCVPEKPQPLGHGHTGDHVTSLHCMVAWLANA